MILTTPDIDRDLQPDTPLSLYKRGRGWQVGRQEGTDDDATAFKDAYRRRIERAVRTFLANRETRERRARWKVGR